MATVHWSGRAQRELDDIGERIARSSERYAGRLTTRFYAASAQAQDFPRLGRMVPEYGQEAVRELIVETHRPIYLIPDPDNVVVVALIHASRDLMRQLGRDPWSTF